MKKFINIVRWIASPFVFWFGYLLIYRLISLVVLFIYARNEGFFHGYLTDPEFYSFSDFSKFLREPNFELPKLLSIIIAGISTILATPGSMIVTGYIVPRYKTIASIVCGCILLLLISSLNVCQMIGGYELGMIDIVEWVAAGIGLAVGCYYIRDFF